MAHIVGVDDYDDLAEPWCFSLFTGNEKIHTIVVVGILYPFFVSWVLIGTLWYAEVDAQGPACFKDPQQSWYFVLWLVLFYVWIIAYTTAITISALIYYRHRDFEAQYVRLIEQYGGNPAPPSPIFQMQGLSPVTIQNFPVHEVRTPEQTEYMCSICLEDIKKGERMRVLSCGHKYHLPCVDNWLLRKCYCPNCKRNFRRNTNDPFLAL